MEEETFLKNRLALDDRHVRMLEKKFLLFFKTLHNESIETAKTQSENLLIQLLSYQTNLGRHSPIQAANTKDIQEYKNIVEKTGHIQSEAQTDIVTLKDDLEKAQKVRGHKLEYDRVAREIMKLNTRDTYVESITELQNDIDLLKREKANKLVAFEDRKRNLTELVQNLKNLQISVEADRAITTDDQARLLDMERGYVSSDDEGDMGLSDEELEEEKAVPVVNHRFQERNDDDDEEEGVVSDAAMVE